MKSTLRLVKESLEKSGPQGKESLRADLKYNFGLALGRNDFDSLIRHMEKIGTVLIIKKGNGYKIHLNTEVSKKNKKLYLVSVKVNDESLLFSFDFLKNAKDFTKAVKLQYGFETLIGREL